MTNQDPRWTQLLAKDPAATFFYSVATTGVYCRPTCAARTPNPKNVQFHATAQAAEAAGYRPCKRCKPNQPAPESARIAAACRAIESAEEPPSLATLAAGANLTPTHFHRVFKQATGLTPRAYAAAHRAHRLRQSLPTAGTVTQAAYDAGFNASSRFYAAAPAILGMSPAAYRAGAPNQTIRFAIGQTTLGALLAAETDKGICAILLGDNPETLLRELQDRFPKARLQGADPAYESRIAQIAALVEHPETATDLPLDIRGTLFQQRVWHALRQIPPGTTLTYSELAQKIDAPSSVRAVARACATNPLAIAIPCHRVVRKSGDLAGYAWGIERKKSLIAREARGGQ